MTSQMSGTATAANRGEGAVGRRWTTVHYLAAAGVLFLAWQGATWIPWILDGPTSVKSPDPNDASRTVAILYQGLAVVMAISVTTFVVRGCLRERRFTLDARICVAGIFTWWMDPLCNWIQPVFLFSSNWVNVTDWTGHVPFIVNPDGGRGIELPLFTLPMYACGFLVNALMIGLLWTQIQKRRPNISRVRLLLIGGAAGAIIEIIMETPVYLARAWAYPGAPRFGSFPIGQQRFPWIEWLTGGIAFAAIAALRHFKDDRDRSIVERGLDTLPAKRRTLVSTLATIGVLNLLWFGMNLSYGVVGLYSAEYPKMPAHLLNDACDLPGTTGTEYGPCPGTPGAPVPVKSTSG